MLMISLALQEDGRKRTVSEPHEIVVSIQRDTTVTFEEQDHKSREVYRKTSSYKARNPVTPVPLSDAISTTLSTTTEN